MSLHCTQISVRKTLYHRRLVTVYPNCVKLGIARGKSLLELWVTTFLPDRQPPLIFVRFISNFLSMWSNRMARAHMILKSDKD